MPLIIRNLDYLRSADPKSPDYGARIYEALQSIQTAHNNVEQQTNSNSTGNPSPPPKLNAINVTAQNGHFNVAITDANDMYRGIRYYVEHADNPNFANAIHTQASGTELRNHNEFLGNVTRYFRAYSAYGSSGPSAAVFHGGAIPSPVSGGGAIGGPNFLPSQSTGTSQPGQTAQGPGGVPFRSTTGVPPVRS